MFNKDTRAVRVLLVLALFFAACGSPKSESDDSSNTDDILTIYSGRSESLVAPVIEAFTASTGIEVEVRYGDTAQLAVALIEEGDASDADIFWAQDAGALGALSSGDRFEALPASLLEKVASGYRSQDGSWLATNARARVLAFSTERTSASELPSSISQLSDPQYANLVGWAPTNGSFQSFVSALRELIGEDATRDWLVSMKENGAKSYPKNSAILQGIANGEIDLGLPNHYYLYRFKAEDSSFPVDQQFFESGDPGNLVNVAGVGVLKSTAAEAAALEFIEFLLTDEMQRHFIDNTFEFPVTSSMIEQSQDPTTGIRPEIDLNSLRMLESTLELLREVELL